MIKDGWYCCPFCGKRLFKVRYDTSVYNFPTFCKKCGAEEIIKIEGDRVTRTDTRHILRA